MSSLLKWCGQFSMQFGFWEFFFSKNRDVPWERQNIILFIFDIFSLIPFQCKHILSWFLEDPSLLPELRIFWVSWCKDQTIIRLCGFSTHMLYSNKILPISDFPNTKLFLFLSSFLNSRVLNFNISDIAKAWLHMSCKYRMIGDMTVF